MPHQTCNSKKLGAGCRCSCERQDRPRTLQRATLSGPKLPLSMQRRNPKEELGYSFETCQECVATYVSKAYLPHPVDHLPSYRNLSLPMGCCFHAARTAHSVVVPKRVIGSFCTCLGLPTYKPTYRSTLHNHSNLKSVRSPKPPSPENKKANPQSHMCAYICIYTYTQTYTYTQSFTYLFIEFAPILYEYICIHVYIYTHTEERTCIYIYTELQVFQPLPRCSPF